MKKKWKEQLDSYDSILSTEQLVGMGISKTTLTTYVRDGVLERCAHGYYKVPNSIEDDLYLVMLRSKHIIFSHETALFLNGLSDRTPFVHTFSIPNTAAVPPTLKETCKCYYVKPEWHKIGLIQKETTFGNIVRCYDAERTLCDILRSRSRIDEETVIAAVKNYAAYDHKNLSTLYKYAELFKVGQQVKYYMEVLL